MDWPGGLTAGPIREWPGTLRAPANRERARFRRPGGSPTPLSTTVEDLDRELRGLRATGAELLVALQPSQFRLDGKPYANAIPAHPGVILSFEIPKIGRVSYPCDKYTRWEDNLRAIVLTLEALRLVARYGISTHGEQYRGFLAIESAAPAGFSSLGDVEDFLTHVIGSSGEGLGWKQILRRAQLATHPDRGGDRALFQRVTLAEAFLREEGAL